LQVAEDVEAALEQVYDVDQPSAGFGAKLRDIVYNVGRNERLRNGVLTGRVTAQVRVRRLWGDRADGRGG
jgi:hypothetical protein